MSQIKKDIPHSEESAIEYFLQGEEKLKKNYKEREKSKIYTLRIGNAGCMLNDTECIGACPQTTLARYLGYQLPTEASQGYFDGGIDNESVWDTNIKAANQKFKCEEQIPILYESKDKLWKLTGRPDMVLGSEIEQYEKYLQFVPRLMLEHKSCQATKSAAEKLLIEKPDTKHLIQAATYSMFLGVPAILVYTINVSGNIGNFFTAKEANSQTVSFGKIEFKLGWDNNVLYYMKGDQRIDTIITQTGILDFYSNISKMAREGLPNLIHTAMIDTVGDMLPYNPRNYNDILNLVDENLPFEEWKEKLKIATNQNYLIKYKTKKGHHPWYEIIQPDYVVEKHRYYKKDKYITKFETLEKSREYVYKNFAG